MNISLRQLRAAISVAQHGSFRRAAESLHLSQPALSLAISDLEKTLGITIFDRTSRSVATTEVGAFFVQGAERVISDFERLVQDVSDVAQSRRGRVVISCVSSVAGRVMPIVLQRCAALFPQVDVTVHDDVAQQVLTAVRTRIADFGLTIAPADRPEGTAFEALHDDRFHLVCRKDHPLAKRQRLAWKEIDGEDLILLSSTSGIHTIIQDEFVRQDIKRGRRTLVSHLSTVHGMLEAGFGIGILPAIALPVPGHPTLVSVKLVQPELSRTLGVFHLRDRSFSPAAAALLEVVRSVLQSEPLCASSNTKI
jgi:DNA-binding transcriptional LysR family regulator